jgi:hypothetical protein
MPAKTITEIRSIARSHTRTAIRTLVGVMCSKEATHAARVSAANAILDRGWGKPPQSLQNGEDGPLELIHRIERIMYDAGKYRLMMKAKDAALARPVPPVQRPGMATTRSERERTDLRALSAKLSNSGDIKDAVALYRARASNRR